MFYIPETKAEIKTLLEEIIARNTTPDAKIMPIDFLYAITLTEAYHTFDNK